jgi:nucleoside-diphosphate-sugar epimerase
MSPNTSTVLVTGATGYIGSRLSQRLLQMKYTAVRALVREAANARFLAAKGVEVIEGDLTDPSTLPPAVAGVSCIYHAAAWVDEQGSRGNMWAVNVEGTRHLIEAAMAAGSPRFVHLSSCAVYGSPQTFGIDEHTPMRQGASLYHDSKIAAEDVVWRAHAQGLRAVVARPSQVYGPGSRQFTLRPVRMIQHGQMILIDGGRFLFKPIYIDNLIDALILCGTHPEAEGKAFNLTDGFAIPWRLYFGAYAQMLGRKRLPSVPFPLAWLVAAGYEVLGAMRGRPASVTRRAVSSLRSSNSFSNLKARRLLGWEPRVGFEEGMRRTRTWLEENGHLQEPNRA